MPAKTKVRPGWLRLMYILTIIIAGGGGVGLLVQPHLMPWMFGVACPQIIAGLVGSIFVAFAFLSVLGLRNPVKCAPILLLQMIYKAVWLFGVILPLLLAGKITADMIVVIVVFSAVIIGDLIAIPFSDIFANVFRRSSKT